MCMIVVETEHMLLENREAAHWQPAGSVLASTHAVASNQLTRARFELCRWLFPWNPSTVNNLPRLDSCCRCRRTQLGSSCSCTWYLATSPNFRTIIKKFDNTKGFSESWYMDFPKTWKIYVFVNQSLPQNPIRSVLSLYWDPAATFRAYEHLLTPYELRVRAFQRWLPF